MVRGRFATSSRMIRQASLGGVARAKASTRWAASDASLDTQLREEGQGASPAAETPRLDGGSPLQARIDVMEKRQIATIKLCLIRDLLCGQVARLLPTNERPQVQEGP